VVTIVYNYLLLLLWYIAHLQFYFHNLY